MKKRELPSFDSSNRLAETLRAIRLKPFLESNYIEASRIYLDLNREAEAQAILRKGISLTNGGPMIEAEAIYVESLCEPSGCKLEKYVSSLEILLRKYPGSSLILGRLMQALNLNQRSSDAIEYGFKFISKSLQEPFLLKYLCQALSAQGLFDHSFFLLSKSKLATKDSDLFNIEIATLSRLGYPQGSIRLFHSAKTSKLVTSRSIRLTAWAYLELWNLRAARELLLASPFDIELEGSEIHVILDLLESKFSRAFGRLRQIQSKRSSEMDERNFNRWRTQLLSQVVNECNLNRFKVERIERFIDKPFSAQLSNLRQLFFEQPNFLGTSLAILTTLRRSGMLRQTMSIDGGTTIPRVIWMYWDQGDPPDEVIRVQDSWVRNNPEFEVRMLDKTAAADCLLEVGLSKEADFFLRQESRGIRADLIRLMLLKNFGGVYVDADDLCRKGVAPLLVKGAKEVFVQEYYGTVANNFLACSIGSKTISRALFLLKTALEDGEMERAWFLSGPQLMTRSVAESLLEYSADRDGGFNINLITWSHFQGFVSPHLNLKFKRSFHWSMERTSASTSSQNRKETFVPRAA